MCNARKNYADQEWENIIEQDGEIITKTPKSLEKVKEKVSNDATYSDSNNMLEDLQQDCKIERKHIKTIKNRNQQEVLKHDKPRGARP